MSLFSRIFGGSKRERTFIHELKEKYIQMWCKLAKFTPKQAKQAMTEAIATCKAQGKAEGTYDLPEDFGNRIIEAASMGEPTAKRIVEIARREGATDDNIIEWWNLPDLSRRMVIFSENIFRFSVFKHARHKDGLSDVESAARVHKMYPKYGNPEDTSILSGENRPLPHELRGRVDVFREIHGAEFIAKQVEKFSSFNAFVRHSIRQGTI